MSESNDEEEDWSNYASAGYSSAYDPWADLVPQEETEDFDDDFEMDEFTSIRPPPSDERYAFCKGFHVVVFFHKTSNMSLFCIQCSLPSASTK